MHLHHESSLRVSERFYRSVVESSYDAVISCDGSGVITMWNRGAERLLGYDAHEMIGRPLHSATAVERRSEDERLLAEVLRAAPWTAWRRPGSPSRESRSRSR